MNNVTRYAVIETALCIGSNLMEGEVFMVMATDHDRELAALREDLAEWKARCGRRVADIGIVVNDKLDLQQRLTAAEQRNAVMTKALERIARPHDCGCLPCTGDCTSKLSLEITVDGMRDLAESALKPTEPGASE